MMSSGVSIQNNGTLKLEDIPRMRIEDLRGFILREVSSGSRIVSLFGHSGREGGTDIFAVTAHDKSGRLSLASAAVKDGYDSLTPDCPQAELFEREIFEEHGIIPRGHPWLKPVRRNTGGGVRREFWRVPDRRCHEVAVGPVHAGIIEPGHFRFQCLGEDVLHLEMELGYQHRGIERALVSAPPARALAYMETVAGDTSIGHALAYCRACEALSGMHIPARAQCLRGIALELERLANHSGDLGALSGDVAYLPTASYCGRLRGDFLNMTALLCGSRFGRSLICRGGVNFDMDTGLVFLLREKLEASFAALKGAVGLLWETPSVLDRFEGTGRLSAEQCFALGLVGPACRACGIERDVRFDFPYGIYRFEQIPVATYPSGDVFARAYVRWLECERSVDFIRSQLESMPGGVTFQRAGILAPESLTVSLVEGWRGEICHVALTDSGGGFAGYKITDPSFHNWFGLAVAMRGEQIFDFPLCNKSFNLSYCGHDL
jgi:Ni,Fe-hydrogenase III large subunit